MRFKIYLTEGRTKSLTEDQLINALKKDAKQIVDVYQRTGRYYYRGIDRGFYDEYGVVKPSKFTRKSAFAEGNTYTLMMDNIPSFKKFPKRSKSIIMTNDNREAEGRGESYVVFPKDGSKIAIAPKNDIWWSFPQLFDRYNLDNLEGLNYFMGELGTYIDSALDMDKWEDIETMLKSKLPKGEEGKSYPERKWDLSTEKTLWDQIVPWMDPKRNKFILTNTKSPVPSDHEREVWTDGDSYLVRADKVDEILEKL